MVIFIFLSDETELEAHIWWFCSTIKYFKTCEYELLTLPDLGDTIEKPPVDFGPNSECVSALGMEPLKVPRPALTILVKKT